MCACVRVCVLRVKKSYLENTYYFTTCALPFIVIYLCNFIICRMYAFPKVQLNFISPSQTGLIFSTNDTGAGTISRLPLSLNLPLSLKNEDSSDFLSSFK